MRTEAERPMDEWTARGAERRPRVPDHELLRCIGRGGYGKVWLARNVVGTHRAVKVVYRDRFDEDRPYEREYNGIRRFEPVSRSHPGLVDILQIGRNDDDGYFYYVMELADDARSRVAQGDVTRPTALDPAVYVPLTLGRKRSMDGKLAPADCLALGIALCDALATLHRHGLIHRDIKPSNIIFAGGVAKLADIGLVTGLDESFSYVGTEGFIPPEGPNSAQANSAPFLVAVTVEEHVPSAMQFEWSPDLGLALRERFDSFQQLEVGPTSESEPLRTVVFNRDPIQIGDRHYDGVRVTVPPGRAGDLVWGFMQEPALREQEWFILPKEAGMRSGFEDWHHGFPRHRVPGEALVGLCLQFLYGRKLVAGQEYLIWFALPDPNPVRFGVVLAFPPAGTIDPNRPEAIGQALGLTDLFANTPFDFHRHYCLGYGTY